MLPGHGYVKGCQWTQARDLSAVAEAHEGLIRHDIGPVLCCTGEAAFVYERWGDRGEATGHGSCLGIEGWTYSTYQILRARIGQ